jgi:hypothetical protein
MAVSGISVLESSDALLPITEEVCPWCEQPVAHEKFEEITSRFEARENERIGEATARLREQAARERAEIESRAKAQLEQVRREGGLALETLRAEFALNLEVARTEARSEAFAETQELIAAGERAREEMENTFQTKLAAAEQSRNSAEQCALELNEVLERVQRENGAAIEALKQDGALRESVARAEGKNDAEAEMQGQVAEAERLASEAIGHMQARMAESELAKAVAETELRELRDRHEGVVGERVQEVREALEREKVEAVNMEKARAYEENLKLSGKVQELQRQLDNKTAEELGDGAEVDLYEALKGEFPDDRIERVNKGESGADIIHVVVHNGFECGTIVYDSKNRNAWRSEYVTKLSQDQMAAKAEHAVLSTQKFPAGERQLCLRDGVVIVNPGRVVALVQVLRKHIVLVQTLRLSNEARSQKTAELYDFITSERCSQFFERIDTYTEDLLELQVKEKKAHDTHWKREGELYRLLQRVRGEISSEIYRIIGTASIPDESSV